MAVVCLLHWKFGEELCCDFCLWIALVEKSVLGVPSVLCFFS
jgi:hypothetical protein